MTTKLTLQHKRSSVTGNQPTAAQIAVGELAINFADKKLYTKTTAGTIIPLGGESKWTDETGGISRADKIKVGSTGSPASAIDLKGSMVRNAEVTTGDMNLLLADRFTILVAADTTFSFSNAPATRAAEVILRVSNGGAFTLAWPANVTWIAGATPVLQLVGTDIIVFWTHDGGITWYAEAVGKSVASTTTSRIPASFDDTTDLFVDIPINNGLVIQSKYGASSNAPNLTTRYVRYSVRDSFGAIIISSASLGTTTLDHVFMIAPSISNNCLMLTGINAATDSIFASSANSLYLRIEVYNSTGWKNISINE